MTEQQVSEMTQTERDAAWAEWVAEDPVGAWEMEDEWAEAAAQQAAMDAAAAQAPQ